jgi:predicted patatin/cPLA2 family phospholipase
VSRDYVTPRIERQVEIGQEFQMSVDVVGRGILEVLNLIRQRCARKKRGEPIEDGHRLCLVVQGGGMRGVYTAGGLYALDALNCSDIFDVVYAASAGAVNAAYFVSGGSGEAVGTYYEDLLCQQFFNPFRFWKMVDLDYVANVVWRHRKPLDEEAIRRSRTRFVVGVTDGHTGASVAIDVKTSSEEIKTILKASSAIPVVYNRKVALGQRQFVDGSLTNPIPIDWAISDGATHCLVLLSQPSTYRERPPTHFRQILYRVLFAGRNLGLRNAFDQHWVMYNRNLDLAFGKSTQNRQPAIATVMPSVKVGRISDLTMDKALLCTATHQMAEGVRNLIDKEHNGVW